jgi:hypothetical protein
MSETTDQPTRRKKRKPMPDGVTRTGRAKRSEERERTAQFRTRLTPEEKARLQANAKAAGLDVAAFVRLRTIGTPGPRTRAPTPSTAVIAWAEWRGQLGKIDSNLTQLARLADMGDTERPADLDRVTAYVTRLRDDARAAMKRGAAARAELPTPHPEAWAEQREQLGFVGGNLNRLTRLANMGDMDRPAELDLVLLRMAETLARAFDVMRPGHAR